MRGTASFVFGCLMFAGLARSAEAQWVRTYHPPVVVSPAPPVFVSPAPVTRVYRPAVVMYQPTTVVYTRHRPILGGTVVRTRPGYRRVVF